MVRSALSTFWIKQERNSEAIRVEDNWTHSIYVASDDKAALNSILQVNNKKILDSNVLDRLQVEDDCLVLAKAI